MTDPEIRTILEETRTIALVGASAKPERPSHKVGEFLKSKGYKVIPVNPGMAGEELHGGTVVASLSEITEPVDMVDIFRRSEAVPEIVEEALAALSGLKTVWMQLGVVNEDAAAEARVKGVKVVMDRCPKIEYPRVM